MTVRVVLTQHVVDQLEARCPELRAPRRVARQEVAEALAAGRVACHKPRRLVPHGPRPRTSFSFRFAWVDGFARVYVVRRLRRELVVVTVLTPLVHEWELELT